MVKLVGIDLDSGNADHPNAIPCTHDVATRAYIAGIIDGEGHIGIKRKKPTAVNRLKSSEYSVRVTVCMTDEAPVHRVADFCGVAHQIHLRYRPPNRPIYEIEITRKKAIHLLREIYPYLLGKKKQADLAFQLDDLRDQSRQHRTKILGTHIFQCGHFKGKPYRVLGLSDEYIAQCNEIYTALIDIRRPAEKQW